MWQKKKRKKKKEKVIGYLCDFIKRILLATYHLDEQTAGELLSASRQGVRHMFR